MASPHEQTATPEQLPIQDRLVAVASAHVAAVLEGKMPLDELAFRVPAVFSRDCDLGEYEQEWADLDASVGHLAKELGEEDIDPFGGLDALQHAIYTNSLPEHRVPLATAFLIQSVDLFKRTVDDNPTAIGSNQKYYEDKVDQAERFFDKKFDRIAKGGGSIATAQSAEVETEAGQPVKSQVFKMPPSRRFGVHN